MRRLPPNLAPAGYSPRRYLPLSPAPVLGMGERLTDLREMQALFAHGENGGYWPALRQYAYEDSAGTIQASVDGVVGLRLDQSQGTVAAARRNLLTYSEDFSDAVWIKGNKHGALTGGQPDPFGGVNAYSWVEDSTNAQRALYESVAAISGTYTFSIYAKKIGDDNRYISIYLQNAGTAHAVFNLSTGEHITHGGATYVANSSTSIGDGWWRFSMTLTSAIGSLFCNAYISPNGEPALSYVGNGASGMYIYGGQLELGASATPYQKIITGAADCLPGNHAIQTTTANKPYLRLTPTTNKPWYDSNTATGALNVTFSGALGSACTVATVTPEGVTIAENQTVGATYNIAPPYGYNSDILIINRALTPAEKALVTRVMQRSVPVLGSELVIDGEFNTPALWTTAVNASVAGGLATFSNAVNADGSYVKSTNTYSFSATGFYNVKFLISSYSSGLVYLVRPSYEFVATGAAKAGYTMYAFKANSTTSTQLQFSQVWNGSNLTASIDSLSIQAIL